MMVDTADGPTGCGADTAHRHALMSKLLEAAQSRVHEQLTARRGSRAVEFRHMPLGCHSFPFLWIIPKRRRMMRRGTSDWRVGKTPTTAGRRQRVRFARTHSA